MRIPSCVTASEWNAQMGIPLNNSEYECPYCHTPGSRSALIQEQMADRSLTIPELQFTYHKALCQHCGNAYVAGKDAHGNIIYKDAVEDVGFEGFVDMKGGYKSLTQQWREAEQAKKEMAEKESSVALLKAHIDHENELKAKADAEFEAKVQAAVEKVLGKRKKGLLW